jgi:hypothetical protein
VSLSEHELAELRPKAIVGEIVEESDYEAPEGQEELLEELRTIRDTLRNCAIFLNYYGNFVQRIGKKEREQIAKLIDKVYEQLESTDAIVEQYEAEE